VLNLSAAGRALSAVLVALATLGGLFACSAPIRPAPSPPAFIGPGFKLGFDDEFDGDALDANRWKSGLPWGDEGAEESQRYSPSGAVVDSGALSLTATKAHSGTKAYASGAVTSDGLYDFTYGYVEMRARIPRGRGLWPAFWLLSRYSGQEIDVLEVLGDDPARNHMTLHLESGASKSEEGSSWAGPDLSAAYHTYAADWEPGGITWYVDGVERFRSKTKVAAHPMCLIANLAVGGPSSWPGSPDAETSFPATFAIDYVRVFERK